MTTTGGKTINLPITNAEALPAENDHYKIEGTGFNAALKKGDPQESKLAWSFSFVSKKSAELDSVLVELVTPTGELESIVKDTVPSLKNNNWVGWSAPTSMTKESVSWLYSNVDSTFVFKYTIKTKDGNSVVMYQPSIISSKFKAMYLQVILDKN